MKRLRKLAITGLSVLFLWPTSGHTAAWTVPQGKYELYLNANTYNTNTYFDRDGKKQAQPRYLKYEINPYAEMGWRDGTTLGATLSLNSIKGTDLPSQQTGNNVGIADPSLFLRQRLWQSSRAILSVQPLLKLPSLFTDDLLPRSGSNQIDAELRLLGGVSFPALGQEHFANLEIAYRKRFATPADQWRIDATLGITLNESWTLLPQLSVIQSAINLSSAAFTQTPQDDFDLIKPQISALYRWDNTRTIQAGAFSHLQGRNTGAGEGMMLSLWWRP